MNSVNSASGHKFLLPPPFPRIVYVFPQKFKLEKEKINIPVYLEGI